MNVILYNFKDHNALENLLTEEEKKSVSTRQSKGHSSKAFLSFEKVTAVSSIFYDV